MTRILAILRFNLTGPNYSQILAIVVAWCDRLHLTPSSTVEQAVDRVRSWADEGFFEVTIVSLRRQLDSDHGVRQLDSDRAVRQLDSDRAEVGSLTEAVVVSGACERTASDEALAEGQSIVGRMLIYSLNAVRDGELEFREYLDDIRSDILIVARMDSDYEQHHSWWCELMETCTQVSRDCNRLDLQYRGMVFVVQ